MNNNLLIEKHEKYRAREGGSGSKGDPWYFSSYGSFLGRTWKKKCLMDLIHLCVPSL
ncbi:MAG: hypothetical protein NPIRA06_25180 [Nitrospirales bacterium]|nr:MAG: hypothetical protein NPIRA06_25180 [Nitrospirales bacterium]